MDPIRRFVTHFVAARHEDLSPEVREAVTWAGAAVGPITHERLECFVAMVEDLEDVKDAGEMAPLLA